MNRRSFLQTTLAAATLPGWLSAAFAEDAPPTGLAALTAAWERAQQSARPLLVILIPPDGEKLFRGGVLGAWINYGDPQLMATLGLFEVVCARAEELPGLIGAAPIGPSTWMVVVDPKQVPAQPIPVTVPIRWRDRFPPDTPTDFHGDENALSELQCALVTRALNAAIPPSWTDMLHDPHRVTALAREATAHLRKQAPPGVSWADSWGCATQIEGAPPTGASCGMGSIPERSQRFLFFFSLDSSGYWMFLHP